MLFSYLHEVEERGIIVDDIGEVDLAAGEYVHLVLTVEITLEKSLVVATKRERRVFIQSWQIIPALKPSVLPIILLLAYKCLHGLHLLI